MKFRKSVFAPVFLCLVVATACDSKHVEAPAKGVNGAAGSLEESKATSRNLTVRLEKLKTVLTNLNARYTILTKAVALADGFKNNGTVQYTPLDMFIDLLDQSQKGIVTSQNRKFQKQGNFDIPVLNQESQCRTVYATIDGEVDESKNVSDVDFSIRGCFNNGEPLHVGSGHWSENDTTATLDFNFNNLQTALDDTALITVNKDVLGKTGCQLSKDSNNNFGNVACVNIVTTLPNTAKVIFESINYSGSGEVSLSGRGKVLNEKGEERANFDFSVPRDNNQNPAVHFYKTERPN